MQWSEVIDNPYFKNLPFKIEPCRLRNPLLPTAFVGKWWANDKAVYPTRLRGRIDDPTRKALP